MKYVSVERLVMANSQLIGNAPKAVVKGDIAYNDHYKKNADVLLEQFGIFETSSPNFNTFYPDVTPEDLKPQDDEFVYPIYRALSQVIVRPHYPVDFSKEGVLEASMPLLTGLAVYPNHEMVSGDELGVILTASWGEPKEVKTPMGKSITIPAGINAQLKIDGKSNPKIARGVMMDPPSIHSVSVTVEFEWEQSHPSMERQEFFDKLGTYDTEGQLIRRVASKINRYYEISFVPHGADPFAKKMDEDGGIHQIDQAAVTYKFSEDSHGVVTVKPNEQSPGTFEFKSLGRENLKEEGNNTIPIDNNNTNTLNISNEDNMDFLLKLQGKLGLEGDNLTEEQLLQKVEESLTALANVNAEKVDLSTQVTNLIADRDTLKGKLDVIATTLREDVVRLAKVVNGDAIDDSLQALIDKADYEGLLTLQAQYGKLAKDKLAGSVVDEEEEEEEEGNQTEPMSLEDAQAAIQAEKRGASANTLHIK